MKLLTWARFTPAVAASKVNELFYIEKFQAMKLIFCLLANVFLYSAVIAQGDTEQVERACLNYIEGFYEGDTVKLKKSLQPSLHKYGLWKDKNTGVYAPDGYMTYR